MNFAQKLSIKLHLLTARCPRRKCRRLHTADPSLLVRITCDCGARLTPVREVVGISFVEKPTREVA